MNVSKGEQTTNKKNDNTVINIDIDSGDEDENSPHSNCLLQHAKLPSYLAHAFQDLYQEDGLLVCGRGMGLLHLIASFCRFYVDVDEGHVALLQEELEYEKEKLSNDRPSHNRQQQYQELPTKRKQNQIMQNQMMQINSIQKQLHIKKPLVFVIGLRNYERSCLISILERWGTPTDLLPTEITNESGQGKDRGVLYARGGIFLITSRILIVDLLTHVASPKDIDGILVAHAENISEQSTEAFILRIYRTQKRFGVENTSINVNQSHSRDGGTGSGSDSQSSIIQSFRYGFIKAFSDAPDTLMSGFAKVDKILKALFVRRLYIYPRFHDIVVEELERTPPIVEELHQSLSPKMMEIQASIAAAVKVRVRCHYSMHACMNE
jgi:DNA excision repair protein ERCC-4